MSKAEAKKEFKANKDTYSTINMGDGWVWRLYTQNFTYDDFGGLVGVTMTPKGSAMGMGYERAKNYLEQTKLFFDSKEYEVFIAGEYWNAPVSFQGVYGMVMTDKDKTKVIHLYPIKIGQLKFITQMDVYDHDTWMGYYEARNKKLKEIGEKTGF